MKKTSKFLSTFLFLCIIMLFFSCEEEEDDIVLDDSNNPSIEDCDFTIYTGSTNCGDGFIAVSDDYCCPTSSPFWAVGTNSCFATCEGAENAGSGLVVRGNNGSGGGNGGGGSNVGELSFWTQTDLGCGPVSVNVSGYGNSTINSYYSNGFPGCGANGNANFVLPAGNYSYNANCNGLSWQGNFTVNQNGCSNIELTSSGGGGGGGSGNGCNWDKGNLVSVTGEFGTRCGNPNSVELLVTNDSNIKLKTFVCIRRSDGSYSGFGDVNGLDPGESFGGFVCDGNGEYIIYAEYWDIYEANGFCNYGGCP